MNSRREFLKLLGKAAAASGVAAFVGLPEANEIVDDPDVPIEFEGVSLYPGLDSIIDQPANEIAKWSGKTWSSLTPINSQVRDLHIDQNDTLYADGEFTSP